VAWLLFLIIIAIAMINYFVTARIANSGSGAPDTKKRVKP